MVLISLPYSKFTLPAASGLLFLTILLTACSADSEEEIDETTTIEQVSPEPDTGRSLQGGETLSIGESAHMSKFWVHCGAAYLDRTINNSQWRATELDEQATDWLPPGWDEYVDINEYIDLVVTLDGPERLVVQPKGSSLVALYEPTNDSNGGCD